MSDLFHEDVPFDFIETVFGIMAVCYEHTFQILTKRPQRMVEFFEWRDGKDPDFQEDPAGKAYDLCVEYGIEAGCGSAFVTQDWPLKNVWLGVSVENQKAANERIPLLLKTPAAIRFLSCEPLLGPVDLNNIKMQDNRPANEYIKPLFTGDYHFWPLKGEYAHGQFGYDCAKIDWVIVGGESGTKDARPMHPDWARSLRDQSKAAGVAFFFKQWGEWMPIDEPHTQDNIAPLKPNEQWHNLAGGMGFHGEAVWRMARVGKKKAGRLLDGVEYSEYPKPVTHASA